MYDQSPSRGHGALAALEAMEPAHGVLPSYRTHIRSMGPIVALIPPAVLGIVALAMLRGSTTTTRGVGGFLAAVLAAPLLPVLGAPMKSGSGLYLSAAVGSAVLWFALGALAAHRATRVPLAGWRHFWGEYVWLLLSVWVGVVVSLVAANLVLGRAVL